MRKLALLMTATLLSAYVCSAETIKASDSRVSYVGRTVVESGSVSFDWSATTIRLRFKGSNLQIKCSDTHKDYFNLWLDKAQSAVQDQVIVVESDTLITLFKGKKGVHEVILQKRTEGEQGCLKVEEFITDGTFLEAAQPKNRIIEFVGDSYTCGYGTEAADRACPFLPSEENPSLTYADILARYFDAEAVHISHSGRGIVRNYGDYNQQENMVKRYAQAYDEYSEQVWEPNYRADLVVIYLGTNDFSTGKQPNLWAWCENYKNLLLKIREFHGEQVPILCVASKADETLGLWVKEAVKRSGLEGVWATQIDPYAHNDDVDLGAAWHPNYKGHRKVASIMAPYVATVAEWDLPFKVLE
ncbi:MAG: GDSL-type esterase/lipase family protein [Candidatus Cryptobacteroides sp.]